MALLFLTLVALARRIDRHPNTIKNWASLGFITVYQTPDGSYAYNLEEVEAAIESNPRMRDKRKSLGENARVVPLPPQAQVLRAPKRAEVVPSTQGADH